MPAFKSLALALLLIGCGQPHRSGETLPDGVDLEEMLLVPAGTFSMGTDDPESPASFGPARTVQLDTYWIDKYAVTNLQYARFVAATGAAPPPHWRKGEHEAGLDFHPVVNVTRDEAAAYARWRGKRLPTEAEWERAARGCDGRLFPWGNDWDPALCNSGESDYFVQETVPVYYYANSLSPVGCFQMAGNVWEWCADRVHKAPYPAGPAVNPQGAPDGPHGVSRGGSWTTVWNGCRTFCRCISIREGRYGYTGFRCARDHVDPQQLEPPGKEQMLLIPAGEFFLGNDPGDSPWVRPDEQPRRRIYLDAFWIDRYCVSNELYRRFVLAAGHRYPPHWSEGRIPPGEERHPVINISWEDASAFAAWAGKRLPSEAEWEKAARGTDGRLFPWGHDYEPARCNGSDAGIFWLVPVDGFPQGASPYGCLQMSGNCWEWVADWYASDAYRTMPSRNPTGPLTGVRRTLRGGTWSSGPHVLTTTARCRAHPGSHWSYTGFRCAMDER